MKIKKFAIGAPEVKVNTDFKVIGTGESYGDCYTKTQSDARYYTKAESDSKFCTKSELNERLDGLTLIKLSQSEYDAMETHDENTLYFVTEEV